MTIEAIIIGAVIAGIAQLSKRRKIDQKYLVTGLSLLCGIAWFMLTPYNQEQIVQARTSIAGSATVVYNILKIAFEGYRSFSK